MKIESMKAKKKAKKRAPRKPCPTAPKPRSRAAIERAVDRVVQEVRISVPDAAALRREYEAKVNELARELEAGIKVKKQSWFRRWLCFGF